MEEMERNERQRTKVVKVHLSDMPKQGNSTLQKSRGFKVRASGLF